MLGRGASSRKQHDRRQYEPRLDPVRWQRPGRGTLIRLTAVTILLSTAALVVWTRPTGCPPAGSPGCDAAASSDQPRTASSESADKPSPAGGSPVGQARGNTTGSTGGNAISGDTIGRDASDGSPAGQNRPAVPPGTMGVPVRLTEPAALTLVSPGDRVELLSVEPDGGPPTRVAEDALVLGITGTDDPITGGLLLALTPAEAKRTVGAPDRTRFAILLRPTR